MISVWLLFFRNMNFFLLISLRTNAIHALKNKIELNYKANPIILCV